MTTITDVREKILEQAMRGNLVPQDENDQPATDLIKEITAERQRKIKDKIWRKIKVDAVNEEACPYPLPTNWMWVRLGQIGDWGSGSTPQRGKTEYYGGDVVWLKTGELKDGYVTDSEEHITELALREGSFRLNQPGDVLIAMYGATIGKLAILEVEATTNQACCACTPSSLVNNKFLFYYLRSLRQHLRELGEGGAQSNISKEKIVNTLFPLPPTKEQDRIVEQIDELMHLCDEWEKEVIFQKGETARLRERILFDATHGLLVTQDEQDEPATALYENIVKTRKEWVKEKRVRNSKPLEPITDDEVSQELPPGWKWVRIGEIAFINPRNSLEDDTEVGFVPMKLIEDGYQGIHSHEIRTWKEVKSGFTHFQEGDIAIAKITPCFQNKKSAVLKNLPNQAGAGTTELHIVRPIHDYVLADYLMCLFKGDDFIQRGMQAFTGTAGQQRVPKEFIENCVIGLPPIEEQLVLG